MSDRDLDVIEIPIDGVLDLHTFAPKDVKELVAGYIEECAALGLDEVRVIHGKGTGALRRLVHGVLERHPLVVAFRLCDENEGGWGAYKVTLPGVRRERSRSLPGRAVVKPAIIKVGGDDAPIPYALSILDGRRDPDTAVANVDQKHHRP